VDGSIWVICVVCKVKISQRKSFSIAMKSKVFLRFYLITAFALAAAAVIPVWHFSLMVSENPPYPFSHNIIAVIPFMAVAVTTLLGFFLLPLLRDMSLRKGNFLILVFSSLVFCGIETIAEMAGARSRALNILMTFRRMFLPDEVAALVDENRIPIEIRLHYYIFSIILIIVILSWLHGYMKTSYGDGKPGNKFLVLYGIAALCYTMSYVFVRVMQYENYAARHLTWGSVLNAAICFLFAALVVGLYGSFFISYKKQIKMIPPFLSILTVLALYGAEFAMLDRGFYLYDENYILSFLIRILIAVSPGILVYWLLKAVQKNE